MERLTVAEAARRLGVSPEAVRKRIKRGTIEHDQDQGGLTHVYVEVTNPGGSGPDPSGDEVGNPDSDARISDLLDQVAYLREENRRKDEIIMQQAITMRELAAPTETPQEPPESPESASEGADKGEGWDTRTEPQSAAEQARVPWWRRLLGR